MALSQNVVTIKIRQRNCYFSALSASFSDFVVENKQLGCRVLIQLIELMPCIINIGGGEIEHGGYYEHDSAKRGYRRISHRSI